MALAVVATTTVVFVQPRPPGLRAHRPAGHRVIAAAALLRAAVPLEENGRVGRWRSDRLVADEAARVAAAAATARPAPPVVRAPVAPAAPPAVAYPPGSVQDIITQAFNPFGAAAVAWGLRVARCESGDNPRAYDAAGPYYGLFQFLLSTFRATPFGGQDIYDPVANANAAAWKYGHGGAGAWNCRATASRGSRRVRSSRSRCASPARPSGSSSRRDR
jgi:hypothetical protein